MRPGRHRAWSALQPDPAPLVSGPDVSSRAPPEGAIPAVPPVGRGDFRHGRAGYRCRADPAQRPHPGTYRAGGRDRPADQLAGKRRIQNSLPGAAGGLFFPPYRPAGRGQSPSPAHQSAADPRQQEPPDAGVDRGGAPDVGAPGRCVEGTFRAAACLPLRGRDRLPGESAAGAGAGLLQPDGLRMGDRPARGAGHGVRGWPFRLPGGATGRKADPGGRLCHGDRAPGGVADGG